MQTSTLRPRSVVWGRRMMPAAIALGLGLVLVLGFAQTAAAQANVNPLAFGNNYSVTGDYVVAGAYGLTSHAKNGFATGTISIPDGNPGITGPNSVPAGAQVVAALVYWQTVVPSTTPLDPTLDPGANGFFRPVFQVTPPNGQLTPYPITGVNLMGQSTVSFSNGGCTGSSTGKVVRTYRADVRALLPRDPDGNVLVDSTDGVTFEVMLPNAGQNTPLTLGATLFVVYRILDPNVPLNYIVVDDGAFAPGNTLLTMTQTVQGFYQAGKNPVSRLTHIVGSTHNNKFQTVYLGPDTTHLTQLPSLYGSSQPAFPAWYGSWDNPTWTLQLNPYLTSTGINIPGNPVRENDASATTVVVPSPTQQGCPSWGAVIVSTTVHDDDKDGILQVWKQNKGYTDVATGQAVSLTTLDPVSGLHDPPATGRQDVYIQLDYVVDANGTSFKPDPATVVSMVKAAHINRNIDLHITDASQTTGIAGANAIQVPTCNDNFNVVPPQLCPYPNQPGIITWRYGWEYFKNQLVSPIVGVDCTVLPTPVSCVQRFPLAQRNSHHYGIFGDALGAANWSFFGGTLTDSAGGTVRPVVTQAGNAVTFYTSHGHGLVVDTLLHPPNGRVTIGGVLTNPGLNGTWFVTGVSCPNNDCSVSNPAPGPYMVQIGVGASVNMTYDRFTDPNLGVASGQGTTGSGFSDLGGAGTLITLGLWGANATVRAQAGTFLHELGHTYALAHGGRYKAAAGSEVDIFEPNCKSNYQSVMNYMFQTRLLGPSGVLDLSSQQLSSLNETALGPITTMNPANPAMLPDIAFKTTRWYDTLQTLAFKTATITSFAINAGVVTFQAVNDFTAGNMVQITGLTTGTYLNGPVLTVLAAGLSSTQFEANFAHGNVSSTADNGTAKTTTKVAIGTPATHHCNGTPLNTTDPPTFLFKGGTNPLPSEILIPWSNPSFQDINFDGMTPGTELPPVFRGYDDWDNVDLRQVGATGSDLFGLAELLYSDPGGLFGHPGAIFGHPGAQIFGNPGALFGNTGAVFGHPGGLFGHPGGLFGHPGASSGGELDVETATAEVDPPSGLTATEDASPRIIHLSWTGSVDTTVNYNIYRSSDNGVNFSLLTSVPGTPAPPPNTTPPVVMFQDTVTCNPTGYQYYVTAVALNTTPPPPTKESVPSNTVSTGQNGEPLTGCYTFTGFSSPAAGSSAVLSTVVPITWSVQDFSNKSGAFVNNTGANTLVAIGPINNDAVCAAPTVNTPRTTIAQGSPAISVSGGPNFVFSFNWNTTGFAPGCYLLELDLDSGQPNAGNQPVSAFQVLIYLSDVSLMVTTASPLPAATETVAYNAILSESGGTVGGPVPFTWTVVAGVLPNGIVLGVAPDGVSGALTGTPTTPGTYNFTVKVTDSIGDFGTKAFTLLVNALVSNTADSGAGSLRQAILDVNAALPGPQPLSILFNVPGAGVQTISPITPLPPLTQPTILDATTQPGYTGTPLIELSGTNAGTPATGIHITAGNSTVRGLVIDSFNGNGILIDTNGGDVIQGNYIGTDKTGATAAPNTGNGIQIIAVPNNIVGGAVSAMRNIISGNTGEGVRIDGTLATGNVVRGNYIGTDVAGSKAVGNKASGVYIRKAPSNSVIGNVVSGNIGFAGITICGSAVCGGGDVGGIDETSNASGNIIQGNLVGTNSSGTAALGNSNAGLSIDGAPNTVVGGTAAGAANTISFNGTNDVQIFDAGASGNQIKANTIHGSAAASNVGINVLTAGLTGNTFSQNSISGHQGLGIDLAPTGVNPNAAGAANNFPVITSAQVASGMVSGTLNGPANTTFTIEFFSNTVCNASLNGEGAVFLGSTMVTTDGTGNIMFMFAAPVGSLVAGNTITATSTDASGTTSEFSACVPVS